MRAACSRADLVYLLSAPEATLLDRCAGLLGFETAPEAKPAATLPADPDFDRKVEVDTFETFEVTPGPAPKVPVKAGFLQVVSAQHVDAESPSAVPVCEAPWERGDRGRVLGFPDADPLVPWSRLWRRLRCHLSEERVTRQIDLRRLLGRIARAETVVRLPRLVRARLAARPQIVLDRTARQMPFWSDQDLVCSALERWTLRDALDPLPVIEGDVPKYSLAFSRSGRRAPDFRGAVVLLLGDLGAYGGERERTEWREAGQWLRGQGAVLRALVPCPFWRVDRGLARLWNAIPWDAGERQIRPLDQAERRERAGGLLELVSPAIRIEPGLLRAARSLLPAGITDSGTEADVLMHPAIASRSSVGLSLDPKRKMQLEAEFDKLDPAIQEGFKKLLSTWHGRLPTEILDEEKFHLARRPLGLFSDGEMKALDAFMKKAAKAIDSADARDTLPPGVTTWFRDLEARLPESVWVHPELGEPLRRAWAIAHRNDRDFVPPPGFTAKDMQVRTRGKVLKATRWRLWQVAGGLVAMPAEVSPEGGPPVPRPMLGEAPVGSSVAEIVAAEPRLLVGGPQQPGATYPLSEGQVIPFPDDLEQLFLVTDRQELHAPVLEKPGWARRAGRDAYGLWAEFEYEGVAQRMRWIWPGRFWMGSPEDEAERYGNEVLHEVELTEGYWLADTACTQELWVAVMRKNRSRSMERGKGKSQRPVENVCWEDSQEFMRRINEQVPGLELRLPTEAEWENACRAGTRTPFSFGKNITPELVNYDGNHPYAGGAKGEYREKTVPVKSLPANPWGFFEMHGNAWEWCADGYGEYEPGPIMNPRGEDQGGGRVVRGGSWGSVARDARSAYRGIFQADLRLVCLGFRVAQGRKGEEVRKEGAEGARGPAEASGEKPKKGPTGAGASAERGSAGSRARSSSKRISGKKDRR